MPNTLAKRVTFGLLSPILAILLIGWVTVPAQAQAQPQVASTAKNIPVQGSGASGTSGQSDLASKKVLILHAFEASMPLNVKTDQGLRASLDSGGIPTKNQLFEYLELVPSRGHEYRKYLAELLRLRYSQRKIDMVITLYAEALQFLLNEGRDIFPDGPILTLYMSPGIEIPKTNRLMIDHQVSYDMVGTLEVALKLVPGAKRVYVVSGVANTDKRMQNQAQRDFKKWEGRLEFQYLSNMSLEQMLTTVSSVPPSSIIFFVAFILDSAGKTYTSRDVVQQISRVSQAPVFGLYDTLLGYGIAGGSLASYERNGTEAGKVALKILGSNRGQENIPTVLAVPPVPMFDWRQLRRWKMSVSALPKGSIIINKETTLWDFRYYIIGALVFCLVETALIIFLIVQRRRKKVAEVEVARARAELLRVERSLRVNEMTASLAHELNQPLAAILSNAQAALRFLKSDKPDMNEFQEIIQDIISDDQRAGNVIRSLRSMVKREEVERDMIILNNVLNEVIQIFHTESIFRNVHVETEFDGSLPPVLGDKVQLQQVALNLILNAADAMSHNPPEYREIILRTGVKDDRIRVTVRDFGPGIDQGNLERIFEAFFTTKGAGLGMGLNICRTIVEAHGGRIWAENNPDGGATFFFEIPISGIRSE